MSTLDFVKSKGSNNIQEYVNSNNGNVNINNLNEVLRFMFSNGWNEINPTDIGGILKPGIQMRYLIKSGKDIKFRSGGFYVGLFEPDGKLTTINKETGEDQIVKESFVVYTSHSGPRVSLQIKNLFRLYFRHMVRNSKKELKPLLFNKPDIKTNYPVFLKKDNKNIVVYYGRDAYSRSRFINSNKYKQALKQEWDFK